MSSTDFLPSLRDKFCLTAISSIRSLTKVLSLSIWCLTESIKRDKSSYNKTKMRRRYGKCWDLHLYNLMQLQAGFFIWNLEQKWTKFGRSWRCSSSSLLMIQQLFEGLRQLLLNQTKRVTYYHHSCFLLPLLKCTNHCCFT